MNYLLPFIFQPKEINTEKYGSSWLLPRFSSRFLSSKTICQVYLEYFNVIRTVERPLWLYLSSEVFLLDVPFYFLVSFRLEFSVVLSLATMASVRDILLYAFSVYGKKKKKKGKLCVLFLFTSSPPFGCKVTLPFDAVGVVFTTGVLSSFTFAFMLKVLTSSSSS